MHRNIVEIVAYGDAYGLPYETRTKSEIAALGGASLQLIEPSLYSDFKDFLGEPIGTWSDDTQHTLIATEALYKTPHSAHELVREIAIGLKRELPTAKGWGGTTKKAIARVDPDMWVIDLINNGETVGNGCGPLMRALPVAAFALRETSKEADDTAVINTTITHNNPENVVSSMVHNRVLIDLMRGATFNRSYAEELLSLIARTEYQQRSSSKLRQAYAAALTSSNIDNDVYMNKQSEAFTSWAVQAVAYRMILDYGDGDLQTLLKHTVEVGGDTDSTASIAASMWALLHSEGDLPADSFKLADMPRLTRASQFLCNLVEASR